MVLGNELIQFSFKLQFEKRKEGETMKKITTIILSLVLMLGQFVPVAATEAAASKALPKMMSGTIVQETADSILVKAHKNDETVILKITDSTYIIDAVKGTPMQIKDRVGDSIVAYYGPIETKSLPAQSNAVAIIGSIPQDYAVPYFATAESVEKGEKSIKVTINNGSIIATITDTIPLSPFKTKNIVALGNITAGTDLLLWSTPATMSFPGSTNVTKAVILGTRVADVVTYELTMNQAFVEKYTTLIPLRKVAEAFGYTVGWESKTRTVTLSKGSEMYTLAIDKNQYGGKQLECAPKIKGTLTYVPLSYFKEILGGSFSAYESKIVFTK